MAGYTPERPAIEWLSMFLTRDIVKAMDLGISGRPPMRSWSETDLRRYGANKLTDAELLALIYRGIEPSEPFYKQIIGRGLWRHALRRPASLNTRQVHYFIAVVEAALVSVSGGPMAIRLKREAKTIVENGLLGHLKESLGKVLELRFKIGHARRGMSHIRDEPDYQLYRGCLLPYTIDVPKEYLAQSKAARQGAVGPTNTPTISAEQGRFKSPQPKRTY